MVDTLGFRARERGPHDFTLRLREHVICVRSGQRSVPRTQRCIPQARDCGIRHGNRLLAERDFTSMGEARAFRARERASRESTVRFRESDVAFRRTDFRWTTTQRRVMGARRWTRRAGERVKAGATASSMGVRFRAENALSRAANASLRARNRCVMSREQNLAYLGNQVCVCGVNVSVSCRHH